MRNDTFDDVDNVPTLKPDADDRETFAPRPQKREERKPSRVSTGPLWALSAALVIALGGLAWWSDQQLSLMERQLVATQESFMKISEDAAGRLKDINGKIVASESTGLTDREALRLDIKQLKEKVASHGQLQQGSAERAEEQSQRLQQLAQSLKTLQEETQSLKAANAQVSKTVDEKMQTLADREKTVAALQKEVGQLRAELDQGRSGLGKANENLTTLQKELADLKKRDQTSAVKSLQGDLLVLRSELDNRQGGSSSADFDAFRAQTNRTISTLQAQIQNLQGQLNRR